MQSEHVIRINGIDVTISVVATHDDGARFDISTPDDRTWCVDVDEDGELDGLVTTKVDGQLADLDTPDWLEQAVGRIRPPA